MKYDEQPDYQKIKNLFVLALKSLGIEDDGVSIQLPLVPSPQKVNFYKILHNFSFSGTQNH